MTALAVLALLVGACGSGPSTPVPSATLNTSRPVGMTSRGSTTTLATAPSPPTTAPALVVNPKAKAKAKRGVLLEVGDSLGQDLAWGMPHALAGTGDSFVGASQGDTGLVATSYYNWAVHLQALLGQYHPVVVVFFMGANDVQDFYVGSHYVVFGTRAWARVYGQRAAELVDEAVSAGAKVLWVGMPPMADPSFSSSMEVVNAIYRREVSAHGAAGQARYLSTWPVLGTAGGGVRSTVPSAAWPGTEELRAPDGIHITPTGAALVAQAVVARLRRLGWL